MMDSLRAWLLGVVLTAFAAGLAGEMVPKGRERAVVRMVGGLLIALALLRPLEMLSGERIDFSEMNLTQQAEEQAEQYRHSREKELSAIIAARIESYIWDKATELGLDCTVKVTVDRDENGVALPETVEIHAVYDPALAVWIEEVVGIPAEKQIWLEDSVWEKETENGGI